MLSSFLTHRYKWKSRWGLLFFHVTIRVASQAFGIGFGMLGLSNLGVFLAYVILGAEGYFTLVSQYPWILGKDNWPIQVLCGFRFLISWHQHNLPSHKSWLEPHEADKSSKARAQKVLALLALGPFAAFFYKDTMLFVHILLALANTSVVFGGGQLAGADYTHPDSPDTITRLRNGKIAGTIGQSVFLVITCGLFLVIAGTIVGEKKAGRRVHPTLWLLFAAWFPLVTRGIFGVLQYGDFGVSGSSLRPRCLI
jgi:hypothetical protein